MINMLYKNIHDEEHSSHRLNQKKNLVDEDNKKVKKILKKNLLN